MESGEKTAYGERGLNRGGKERRKRTPGAERVDRWAPTTRKVRAPPSTGHPSPPRPRPPSPLAPLGEGSRQAGRGGGGDGPFINIYREMLNSSLVANEKKKIEMALDTSRRAASRDYLSTGDV